MQVLSQDFREFLTYLNANKVEYLIIGGYAIGFYGYPRFTGDLDVWIKMSSENAKRVVKTLRDFGFPTDQLNENDFVNSGLIFQIGYRPQRIDIMTNADGVDFDECYTKRAVFDSGGLKINFISLEHLKINKKASGRHIDLNDLENLE